MSPPTNYFCYFKDKNGKKGGISLKASNDYEAAKEFWELSASGQYKHLRSFKIVTQHLLVWYEGDNVKDAEH